MSNKVSNEKEKEKQNEKDKKKKKKKKFHLYICCGFIIKVVEF
jgi:hypothetical protein